LFDANKTILDRAVTLRLCDSEKRGKMIPTMRAKLARSKPRQLGNLHERMRFALDAMIQHGEASIPLDLWNGVWDLATEVEGHAPAKQPYGRRLVPLGGGRSPCTRT